MAVLAAWMAPCSVAISVAGTDDLHSLLPLELPGHVVDEIDEAKLIPVQSRKKEAA